MKTVLQEIHPGEILRDEFLVPLGLPESVLFDVLEAPREEVAALIAEQGPVTASVSRALASYFKTSSDFWMSLQAEYERRLLNGGRQ